MQIRRGSFPPFLFFLCEGKEHRLITIKPQRVSRRLLFINRRDRSRLCKSANGPLAGENTRRVNDERTEKAAEENAAGVKSTSV